MERRMDVRKRMEYRKLEGEWKGERKKGYKQDYSYLRGKPSIKKKNLLLNSSYRPIQTRPIHKPSFSPTYPYTFYPPISTITGYTS